MGKLLEKVGIRPDISLGNLLSIVSMLVMMFTAIWAFSGRVSNIERDLANEIKIATEGRLVRVPKLEEATSANEVQDEKLDRLSQTLAESQTTTAELTKAVNDLRVLVAVLNSKTGTDGVDSGVTK